MLRSSLFDYSNAYTLLSGAITIRRAGEDDASKK